MAIIKWSRYVPSMWPSVFDDDNWPTLTSNWPDLSSSTGLDIYETDTDVVVKAAVPGLADSEVEVTVEGNVLTITGEHKESNEETREKKTVYKSSRQTSFSYSGRWHKSKGRSRKRSRYRYSTKKR